MRAPHGARSRHGGGRWRQRGRAAHRDLEPDATLTGLKSFLDTTLGHGELMARMQPVKLPCTVPVVLSTQDAAALIAAVRNVKHRAPLSVAYGSGLRASEVCRRKVGDVDSERMALRVEQGQGAKDRCAMPSPLVPQRLHLAGQLQFFGDRLELADAKAFRRRLAPVRRCEWVVCAKRPFAGPDAVLGHLSRCTHRGAISNSRLLALDERGVAFRWKHQRARGRTRDKAMTIAPDEFMRRFLLHVLPGGFHRIRHCALLANGHRRHQLATGRRSLAPTSAPCVSSVPSPPALPAQRGSMSALPATVPTADAAISRSDPAGASAIATASARSTTTVACAAVSSPEACPAPALGPVQVDGSPRTRAGVRHP